MSDIAKRASDLREQLHYHIYRYNVLNDPIITDSEYDKLYHELVSIEDTHPELRTIDSPTQRVGFLRSKRPRPLRKPQQKISQL